MNIGQKIKELRQEHNLTQEELAEQLGVSFQAVSRWENSVTFPDITMLPIIANMFDVTTDYLLDMDSYKKDDDLKKIIEQNDILANQGKIKEQEKLLLEALKKYPNNWDLKSRILGIYHFQTANGEETDEYYQQKAIELGNHILDKCNIDKYRYSAIETLCFVYNWTNQTDKAIQIVEKLPDSFVTSDYLMLDLVKGSERNIKCAEYITTLIELFHFAIYSMRLSVEDTIAARKKEIEILNVIFDNDDLYWYNTLVSDAYEEIARMYARINNKEEMIKNLEKAFECGKRKDEIQKEGKVLTHTSVLVNGYECNPLKWRASNECTHVEIIKERLNGFKEFKKYLNDEDFVRLIKKY